MILSAHRFSSSLLAHLSLAGFTILSALGIMLNFAFMPMVLASLAALASWDLALEMNRPFTTKPYEKLHFKYLGTVVGLGLAGTVLGQWIHWRLPFSGTVLFIVALWVFLNQVMNLIPKDKATHG